MKNLRITISAALFGTFGTLAGAAHANGFLVNEFDARAVGRGNAETATDVDPSSIYYNVGGLASAEGTHIMIGGALIAPSATYIDTTGAKTDSTTNPQVVPHVFASMRIHPMVAVGVGFYTPFGLAINWPDSAPTNDVLRSEALHTYFITPSVGVNLGSIVPGLTAGGGFDIVPATVDLQESVFFGSDTGNAHLGGTALGFGGRLGVMYVPHGMPQLSLGAMWRSDVKENFTGTGNFDAPSPYRSQLPPDGGISTTVTLPQSISGGAAYRPMPNFEIEADLSWTNWSKFKSLDIAVPMAGGGTMTLTTPENYTNTYTVRAGVEYDMPLLGLGLRAGYMYNPSPVPSTSLTAQLPDTNRNDLTLGASKSLGNYDVHVGLLYVLPSTRGISTEPLTPEHKGSYDVTAFVAAVSLAAKFK